MKQFPYYIGICKICGGMLEIYISYKDNRCSIMCDECLAEYDNPEDALKNINGYRKSYTKAEARIATMEEITMAGWWEQYVINKAANT